MPIDAKLTSPVLSEGVGTEIPLCTLPLAEGYTATISQFEVMAGNPKVMSVKVVGSENVSVETSSFDTFKVEIKPVEGNEGGSTLWIAKETRQIVKTEQKLPAQMGGGIVTSELVR